NGNGIAFIDFAHSPSKVRATVDAVAERYPDRNIIACFELHTYSSLSKEFLPLYKGTMKNASYAFVYFNPHELKVKKLPPLSKDSIKDAFDSGNLAVFDNSAEMFSFIKSCRFSSPVYLFMSSGDYDGKDLQSLSEELF
ncbi:MAG: peptidoglycan synthetase, partial [Bacteroidales bacterium]